jgi:crossover junction endodeoxyribonuclease RuvC
MLVLAVDPGLSGGLAIISEQEVLLLTDLPVHKIGTTHKKTLRAELDLHGLHLQLTEHAPYSHAFVEKVSARPGQGTVSMFRFGVAFGSITGLLVAMGVPLTFVQPKEWQKYHAVGPAPDAARQRATQLYPQITPLLMRKADGNRADALLLANFGLHRLTAGSKQVTSVAA